MKTSGRSKVQILWAIVLLYHSIIVIPNVHSILSKDGKKHSSHTHDAIAIDDPEKEMGTSTADNDEHGHEESDDNNIHTWWRGNNAMLSSLSHPHLGAMHQDGTLGMIIDPSPLRLRLFDPRQNHDDIIQQKVLCPPDANVGIEEEGGNKILQKIKGGIVKSKEFLRLQQTAIDEIMIEDASTNATSATLTKKTNLTMTVPIYSTINKNITTARATRSKILCMVYTVHLPPNYDNRNVRAQAETWGQQCDGFIAASNMTDHDTGSINLPHLGPEIYGNVWQKVRSMWAYAHDHYRDEFDFFHICGDDVYVFVDNLRAYLDGPEVTSLENGKCELFYKECKWTPDMGPRPLYFGQPFFYKGIVPAGGPGYTLNRAALSILNRQLDTYLPENIDSREDILLGGAMHGGGVEVSLTLDANNGGERYGESAQAQFDFYGNGPTAPLLLRGVVKRRFRKFTLPPPKLYMDSISDQYVSAHLKDRKPILEAQNHTIAELIYRYHAVLNDDWCMA